MVEMNLTFVNFELPRSLNPWRLGGANTYSLKKFIPHILFIIKFQFLFNFFWHNQIHIRFLHLSDFIFQNILKKLTNPRNECNNRTELLISAWQYLQQLITIGADNLDKWVQCVIKYTLESMLMVNSRLYPLSTVIFVFFSSSNQISLEILTFFLISGLQKIGNERLRAIKSKNKWMRNAANTQFECSLSVWIYCEEYRWTMVSCNIEINLERGKRCA